MTKTFVLGHSRDKTGKTTNYHLKTIMGTLKQPSGNQEDYIISFPEDSIPDQSPLFPVPKSQTTTSLLEDSPARHLVSPESVEALMTPEERYSLMSQGYSRIRNRGTSFLKTSKDCYLMTTETLSKPSSPRLQSWGMVSNGKCLTARISESHRIGKECSLSDILEENPDPKYFLSEEMSEKIIGKFTRHSMPITIKDTVTKEK